ncbi:PH domain-containing protein [Psidium guajava]|nr:PH domain-containing protein [Psidium guajava]
MQKPASSLKPTLTRGTPLPSTTPRNAGAPQKSPLSSIVGFVSTGSSPLELVSHSLSSFRTAVASFVPE